MKTSVVMQRKMGGFVVHQRTKDGMFNATSLIDQYNKHSGKKKEIKDFFLNKSTQEFIKAIQEDDTILNRGNSPYLKSRGRYGGTWMNPYLFIDFAMWLEPKFKLQVIKFVHDQLIKFRHDAGDNYKLLSSAGAKLKGYDYVEVATAMQYIVFNKKSKNLRQEASEEQLKELSDLEKKLSFAIDMGFIKNYPQLKSELRRIWRMKHQKVFQSD